MQNYLRKRREAGFTLIELLIVIAIIGIIATILIPELLDALQKAKQKDTVGDARSIGVAMFEWITDEGGAAAAGTPQWLVADYVDATYDVVNNVLVRCSQDGGTSGTADCPDASLGLVQYIQNLPATDGWGREFDYFLNTANPLGNNIAAIFSCGRPAAGAADACQAADTDAVPFFANCYEQDIVWADGTFAAFPVGRQQALGSATTLPACDPGVA